MRNNSEQLSLKIYIVNPWNGRGDDLETVIIIGRKEHFVAERAN